MNKVQKPIKKQTNQKKATSKKKKNKKRKIKIITRCTILFFIVIGLFFAGYSVTVAMMQQFNSSKNDESVELKGDVVLDNATEITVNGLLNSIINRSYKTVEGDEELKFYSKEGKKNLITNKVKEKTKEFYKANELEQKIVDRRIKKSYYEGSTLVVEPLVTVETIHGNEEYENYVEPIGTKNEMTFKIVLVKEDSEYKVQYYYTLASKVIDEIE